MATSMGIGALTVEFTMRPLTNVLVPLPLTIGVGSGALTVAKIILPSTNVLAPITPGICAYTVVAVRRFDFNPKDVNPIGAWWQSISCINSDN